jgi:hypothetical protein
MKKIGVLALAVMLFFAFTVPASALENIFGGFWRTRMYQQRNFDGDNLDTQDNVLVDTRTRLYYTAKLNDNLKFVNKFEFDTVWGSAAGFGRVGTDAVAIEIKNSYADFNLGPVNVLVGAQDFYLARGFIADEDGVGMKVVYKVNDSIVLPFAWQRMYDGNDAGVGEDRTRGDIDLYVFAPGITLSKDVSIRPIYVFAHAQDGAVFSTVVPAYAAGTFNNINISMAGLDFDAKLGPASLWFTGIKQFGDIQLAAGGNIIDVEGYLLAAGGNFNFGKADIHGQAFFATGEENGVADGEISAFLTTGTTSYYWAEIMGSGVFDNQVSAGSCDMFVSNVLAANIGTTITPTDKLSVSFDLWYAKLDEENAFGEDELGLETDVKITYQLVEGLSLDVVGAYLFAGDATSADGKNNKDPYEFGTQLSLSF